jgi:hypothetical protein
MHFGKEGTITTQIHRLREELQPDAGASFQEITCVYRSKPLVDTRTQLFFEPFPAIDWSILAFPINRETERNSISPQII